MRPEGPVPSYRMAFEKFAVAHVVLCHGLYPEANAALGLNPLMRNPALEQESRSDLARSYASLHS